MTRPRMHADEIETDAGLVQRLLAGQFPEWAGLPIERVASTGTDNALYRLGEALVVRMPRRPGAERQVEREQRWLPLLAGQLPIPIPVPLAKGGPGEGYPCVWTVCRWFEGENPGRGRETDCRDAASDLGRFVRALRGIDATGGPAPGRANFGRGLPLSTRDAITRRSIPEWADTFDAAAMTEAWERALAEPEWAGPPAWLHGDLMPGNVVVRNGRLVTVIDWGGMGVGDPACDLMAAWGVFDRESREAFRQEAGLDDAAWGRGRGWALSTGLNTLPYYRETNPAFVAEARGKIAAVLEDAGLATGR